MESETDLSHSFNITSDELIDPRLLTPLEHRIQPIQSANAVRMIKKTPRTTYY